MRCIGQRAALVAAFFISVALAGALPALAQEEPPKQAPVAVAAPSTSTFETIEKFVLTPIMSAYRPNPRDYGDKIMKGLMVAYTVEGYLDLFTTMVALRECATCSETSPIFGTYFNGRPGWGGALAAHTAVNAAYVTAARKTHDWIHARVRGQRLAVRIAFEGPFFGAIAYAGFKRGEAIQNNVRIIQQYRPNLFVFRF